MTTSRTPSPLSSPTDSDSESTTSNSEQLGSGNAAPPPPIIPSLASKRKKNLADDPLVYSGGSELLDDPEPTINVEETLVSHTRHVYTEEENILLAIRNDLDLLDKRLEQDNKHIG